MTKKEMSTLVSMIVAAISNPAPVAKTANTAKKTTKKPVSDSKGKCCPKAGQYVMQETLKKLYKEHNTAVSKHTWFVEVNKAHKLAITTFSAYMTQYVGVLWEKGGEATRGCYSGYYKPIGD